MPSGFLVLADGRCFARRWRVHDAIMQAIGAELARDPDAEVFHDWWMGRLPGDDAEEEEIGFGAWVRANGELVVKFLDTRLLTPRNRQLFCEATKRAATRIGNLHESTERSLLDLVEMIERCERGEPPLSMSNWSEVVPPKGERIGPGWESE